jgi:sugar-specific transcriptional regulator TrmB
MRAQDAVDTLREALDLAPSEAAIYVHLCAGGPAKAGELAGTLKLHRNEIYRNAARLLQRGIIEMTLERPARYAAVDPQRVFDEALSLRIAAVETLKDARGRALGMLAALQPPEPPEKKSVYKVIQGRHEIALAQNHLLEQAHSKILWATTFPASVRLADATGALEILARRAREGLELRAAVHALDAGWKLIESMVQGPRVQLRELDLGSDIRFLIIDGEEILMWVVNDLSEALKAKDEVAIQTTAPGFVQAEGVFFEQAWAGAKPREPR